MPAAKRKPGRVTADDLDVSLDAPRDWLDLATQELKGGDPADLVTLTPEGIAVKPIYTADDLEGLDHLDTLPGRSPYTRGPKATMYTGRPWTIRQYAGFSTAEESNRFYRQALEAGQRGLSVAFDLATHRGYDSDHPRVVGDVGKAGVAIDSVEDMKVLFDGIPLAEMSVSMTMNGAVIPVLASFIVAGEEQGVERGQLSGTIQNDILKEFMVRNTYIYPPEPSMRIVADIIAYTAAEMPRFNSISISGYHMQEAGATLAQELAFTLADGREYVAAAIAKGMDVDAFAGRLSFFFCIGMDFFMEAAKLRAARTMWSRIMEGFGANERSQTLRTHCQTSGVSLQERDPYNNVVRTAYEAMSAVLGGTQSLHTNSFDEAIALPSDFAARIARNTQLIVQHETGVTRTVDPLAGSYYVESLTDALITEATALMDEIDRLGGMTAAIERGYPKGEIERAAAAKQARIDNGTEVIVGVNRFRPSVVDPVEVRDIDNRAVREAQVRRLNSIRRTRDQAACDAALEALERTARSGEGNLLEAAVEAARARATVGEMSDAMERAFGRHTAEVVTISGVYAETVGDHEGFSGAKRDVEGFASEAGRKPKVLIVKMGQDGHDRGAKVIATAFGDLGFDVAVGPLFQSPEEAAALAVETGADVVGMSTLGAGHKTLAPLLLSALAERGAADKIVICGGVIPSADYDGLKDAGIRAIFGPGTNIPDAARELIELLREQMRGRNR